MYNVLYIMVLILSKLMWCVSPYLFIISSINLLWSILILTPMSMRGCVLLYWGVKRPHLFQTSYSQCTDVIIILKWCVSVNVVLLGWWLISDILSYCWLLLMACAVIVGILDTSNASCFLLFLYAVAITGGNDNNNTSRPDRHEGIKKASNI